MAQTGHGLHGPAGPGRTSGGAPLACGDVRWRLGRRLLALVALAVVAAGCKADVTVTLDGRDDGSGTVRVEVVADADLAARADLSSAVRADDLRQAGWAVSPVEPHPGGGVQVVASKPFADAAAASDVVAEVAGPGGPLQGFRLSRARGLVRSTTRFEGTVDLGAGLSAFGDPGVAKVLGTPSGLDPAEVAAASGGRPLVDVHVAVHLPGPVAAEGATVHGSTATWDVPLGQRRQLLATSTDVATRRLAGVGVAVVALALAGVVLLVRPRRRATRRR